MTTLKQDKITSSTGAILEKDSVKKSVMNMGAEVLQASIKEMGKTKFTDQKHKKMSEELLSVFNAELARRNRN